MPFKQALNRIPRDLLLYYILLAAWASTTAMHIPDGYLSPATSLVMFLMALPFWARGVHRLRQRQNAQEVPLIALMAGFSFIIMMFNVPLPGGTSGHAVGAALAAVLLGPEIATLAVSAALLIQALFFGDGGILALGANSFNMAVVVPYVSYAVFQALSRGSSINSRRRLVGAALGGWAGLTTAAFFAGVEFGLQPLLFRGADGAPLYAPYPLSIAVPAMVIPHALVASMVEGAVTALVLATLQRSNPGLLEQAWGLSGEVTPTKALRLHRVWVLLGLLALAAPLGLLASGTAWGEWGAAQLARMGRVVPRGLVELSNIWNAPLPGYGVYAFKLAGLGYAFSALLGLALTVLLLWVLAKLFTGHAGARSRGSSIESTLASLGETLERSLFADEMQSRPGLLQSLDPALKLVGLGLLVLGAGLAHHLEVLVGLYAGVQLLAWLSRLPLSFFMRRVWLALPFFTGLLALPATFLTPGPVLWQAPLLGLAITRTGLVTALFLLLRVSVSVSLGMLLVLTTPWNTLLNALRVLRLPGVVILMLGMTYRYLYLLLRLANDMFLARKSRLLGRLPATEQRRVLAAASGALLTHSLDLSGEVYLAMRSRGYNGAARPLQPLHRGRRDWAGAAVLLLISIFVIFLGR